MRDNTIGPIPGCAFLADALRHRVTVSGSFVNARAAVWSNSSLNKSCSRLLCKLPLRQDLKWWLAVDAVSSGFRATVLRSHDSSRFAPLYPSPSDHPLTRLCDGRGTGGTRDIVGRSSVHETCRRREDRFLTEVRPTLPDIFNARVADAASLALDDLGACAIP